MENKKLALVGCGKLNAIVAHAWKDGLLSGYELVGVTSRTAASAEALAEQVGCKVCANIDELLALKPDYLVESASIQSVHEIGEKVLRAGCNLVLLSIGALADEELRSRLERAAVESGSQVHVVSGAIGGFDVMRTAALMGEVQTRFITHKGPDSLKNTAAYTESLQTEKKEVFNGTAREAIGIFPTKVNVAVAASLASCGTDKTHVSINSVPEFEGDDHRIEVRGEEVFAVVDIYSKTSAIAGWSVVARLQNLIAPIVF